MIFYRRFPGDYLIDTMTLSWLEDCAFTRLLDWQYRTERSIDRLTDAVSITRARTTEEKHATKTVYERFFPGGINKRFAEELSYTNGKRKQAKEASALGVAARKRQPTDEPNGQPDGQPGGDLYQTSDSRHQNKPLAGKRSRKRVAPSVPPLFREFWNRYPGRRRGDEAKAIREFSALSESEQLHAVESLSSFVECDEWLRDHGRYIPNSEKFLRQKKFTTPPESRQKGARDGATTRKSGSGLADPSALAKNLGLGKSAAH